MLHRCLEAENENELQIKLHLTQGRKTFVSKRYFQRFNENINLYSKPVYTCDPECGLELSKQSRSLSQLSSFSAYSEGSNGEKQTGDRKEPE